MPAFAPGGVSSVNLMPLIYRKWQAFCTSLLGLFDSLLRRFIEIRVTSSQATVKAAIGGAYYLRHPCGMCCNRLKWLSATVNLARNVSYLHQMTKEPYLVQYWRDYFIFSFHLGF